jgi:hypothetical protein
MFKIQPRIRKSRELNLGFLISGTTCLNKNDLITLAITYLKGLFHKK